MRRSARGLVIEFAELSDAGRDPSKQINEDSCAYEETQHGHLALVCDGMGGHKAGKRASETAVATILEGARHAPAGTPPAVLLRSVIERACQAVHELGGNGSVETRPGTTCVATLLYDGKAEIAHVGDSRLYLIRGGSIQRITRDHSLVQQMLDAGLLSEAQAAVHPDMNRITRALGMFPVVDVDVRPTPLMLMPGDVLLLASDGLTDMLDDHELLNTVRETLESGPEVTCQRLVDMANAHGGHDNITVQVLLVVESARRVAEPTLVDGAAPNVPATLPLQDDVALRTLESTRPNDGALMGRPRTAAEPTLVDEPSPQGGRLTEPWVQALPTAQPRISMNAEGAVAAAGQARQRRKGRLLVAAAAIISLSIVAGIAVWWLLGAEPAKQRSNLPDARSDAGELAHDTAERRGSIPPPTLDGLDPLQRHSRRGGLPQLGRDRLPGHGEPSERGMDPLNDAGLPSP